MGAVASFLRSLRGGRLAVALVLGFALLLLVARGLVHAYVEILWQQGAGYEATFWRRIAWTWGARIVAGLAVAGLVHLNLAIAAVSLGGIHIRRRFGNIEISEQLPRSYVAGASLVVSALLGLWFGAAVPANLGVQIAAMMAAGPWGATDPLLGRDLGFYVFQLPVLASAVTFGLVAIFLVFTLASAGYATTGALRWVRGRVDVQDLARVHLGSLVSIFLLLVATRVWLARPLLLLSGNSEVQGIFGFSDAQARMPALQTLVVILVAAAIGVGWGAWRARGVAVLVSLTSVLVGGAVITQMYPSIVQRFQVEPNELARETPYIEHNLRYTRLGFGLDALERRSFAYEPQEAVRADAAREALTGLPVWNRSTLLQTFRSLEARFPYYDFPDVTIDRYEGPEGASVVALSVRELDPSGIQDPNWQNLHLRDLYVRGMGVVMSRAATRSTEARPDMLVSGLPPERTASASSFPEIRLDRPEIYFGSTPQLYALIDPTAATTAPETGPPGTAGDPSGVAPPGVPDGVREAGALLPDGIPLRSRLRTALLAWRFRDANLFFASDLAPETRLVFRRRVQERAQAIAPFLRFAEAPYAVLVDGRVVWVLEGFTGTRAFPLASPHEFGALGTSLSYVRNSVKVTVDALTGAVSFYRVPVEDPLADAYAAAFPGLFRPLDAMPVELRRHLRYPRALFDVQSDVLLQYHQETAEDFHGQQDVWAGAQQQAETTSPERYVPEYGLYTFPGDTERRFQLTNVFVPAGRQNLTGVLAGRTDDRGVPEPVLLDVSVADQVPGPRQIEALVEQDPLISQQFSLWRTGGSQVWTGHLHLVPVGGRMLYFEPVFLAAESNAIPELRRFLVSDGRRVVMSERLEDALAALVGEASPPGGSAGTSGGELAPSADGSWPDEALRILERADERMRAGDWPGYGAALEELRSFLERVRGPQP